MRAALCLALIPACVVLAGCQGANCSEESGFEVRSPFRVNHYARTEAGARLIVGPPTLHEMRVVSDERCAPDGRIGGYRVVGP